MCQHWIVIGGGIIGMLTARELSLANQKVTLVERGRPGGESSWAGGGIISPLFPWRYPDSINRLANYSQTHYPALCAELLQHTGIDPEFNRNGMLAVAPDDTQIAHAWAQRYQQKLVDVDRQAYQALEPAAAIPSKAFWLPEVGQIRNPRLIKALHADLQKRQIEILAGSAALRIEGGQICTGVTLNQQALHADGVIVCAGAWSQNLLKPIQSPPAIWPVRGQMLLFNTPPDTIQRIVLEEGRYVIPRRDGRVLFGSTVEDVGFNKETTQKVYHELHEMALKRFPVLGQYPVEKHWAGLRPGSLNGIPYIDQHSEISNLYINAGHYRNGIVLGLGSARLLTDLILNRVPILDPSPYQWTAERQ